MSTACYLRSRVWAEVLYVNTSPTHIGHLHTLPPSVRASGYLKTAASRFSITITDAQFFLLRLYIRSVNVLFEKKGKIEEGEEEDVYYLSSSLFDISSNQRRPAVRDRTMKTIVSAG